MPRGQDRDARTPRPLDVPNRVRARARARVSVGLVLVGLGLVSGFAPVGQRAEGMGDGLRPLLVDLVEQGLR